MKTILENNKPMGNAHVSCIKYRFLNNISHYHGDFELIYVNSGTATVNVNENFFNLKSDEAIFIHKNDIHFIESDESTVISVLKADSKYFDYLFNSVRLASPVIQSTNGMGSILQSVFLELKNRNPYSDVMADCLATELLISILRSEKTVSVNGIEQNLWNMNSFYDTVSRKISEEYSTLTFDELCKHMHFTKPYFSKVFHSVFGMTFTQYLNTVKTLVAIEKLRDSKKSATEVCSLCGFNTIRNFNRVFKKMTGYTPTALPQSYVFLYSLQHGEGLDPTLNCTSILEE